MCERTGRMESSRSRSVREGWTITWWARVSQGWIREGV